MKKCVAIIIFTLYTSGLIGLACIDYSCMILNGPDYEVCTYVAYVLIGYMGCCLFMIYPVKILLMKPPTPFISPPSTSPPPSAFTSYTDSFIINPILSQII